MGECKPDAEKAHVPRWSRNVLLPSSSLASAKQYSSSDCLGQALLPRIRSAGELGTVHRAWPRAADSAPLYRFSGPSLGSDGCRRDRISLTAEFGSRITNATEPRSRLCPVFENQRFGGWRVLRTLPPKIVVPALRRGRIAMMDNLVAHKSARVRELIEERAASDVFAPPTRRTSIS